MSGDVEIEKLDHAHEEGEHSHDHDHGHEHGHKHGHKHGHAATGTHTHDV
jgi:zinc/manganese transport system ATP-binding protein